MIRNAHAGELEALFAAGLISRLERCHPEEIYEKAINCFDVLVNILENEDAAAEIGLLINRDTSSIRNSAETIIDSMLFNMESDPYITLCLPRSARKEEAKRRWKRLMVCCHPDKYSGRPRYEEKAKKINEAYRTFLVCRNKRAQYLRPVKRPEWSGIHDQDGIVYFKYLNKLPYYILGFAVFLAAISLIVFTR